MDYLRVWLAEMYLGRRRQWFTEWHPAVHTVVRVQQGTRVIEIPQVVGEFKLAGVDAAHLNNAVHLNVPLTTLLPFNGGTIELVAGLLALPGDRGIGGFVDTLSRFAGLLAVPSLSAALAVADPLANGIQQLITSTNGGLHLGLHQSFSAGEEPGPHTLSAGYVAIVRVDAAAVEKARLCVTDGRLTNVDGGAFTADDYLLLRLEKRSERDDWEGLSTIMDPFSVALSALGDGARSRADALLRVAIVAVLNSPELTTADRRRVGTALRDRFQEALELGLGASRDEAAPRLTDLVARGPSVEQAAAMGAPALEELLPA